MNAVGAPVGTTVLGEYVPVIGADPVFTETVAVELMTVLMKLSPLSPCMFTRFKTCPLGALRLMIKSLSNV